MIGTVTALGILVGQMVYSCVEEFPEATEDAGFYAVEYVEEIVENNPQYVDDIWKAYDRGFNQGYKAAEQMELTCTQFETVLEEAESFLPVQ